MPEIFRYEIKKESESTWRDISRLINSEDTSITNALCTTEWKSATNTASFSLRYADKSLYSDTLSFILEARSAGERIDVRITSILRGEVAFSGYLDESSISIASSAIPEALELSARDYITLLDDKIQLNIVKENESVESIIALLLQTAGYTGALYSELPQDARLQYFVVTSDDDETFRDIIDSILFERCGYVLYRNPALSRYEIRKIVPEGEPERIAHYVISDTLSTSSDIFDNDGVKIEYPTISTKTGAVLYAADIQTSVEDGELKGEEIQGGHYYPSDGDITPTYQEYDSSLLDRAYQTSQSRKKNDDISLLYAKNAKAVVNPGGVFDFPVLDNLGMPSNPSFYPRKAWVLLRNNSSEAKDLLTFTIEGDAVYKSRINKVTMPDEARNPEEYETSHIYTETDAVAFGNFYLNFRLLSSAVTTWTEKDLVSELGEKVIIKHKGTDIAQAHVVVQITDESFSGGIRCYRVTAVSVSGYSEYTWATESSSGSVTQKQISSDTQQYYYSTSYDTLKGGKWYDSPQDIPGTALWLRRKIVYTDGSVWLGDAYCVSASADDTAPKYYYKYTKTNDPDAWKGGGILFALRNKLLAVGSTLLSAGMAGWTPYVPEGIQYQDDFLWTKIVHSDGRVDIIPPAKQGEPAYGIEIIAEPESYQLTTRNVVKDDPAIINLSIKRHYVSAPAVWSLTPSGKEGLTLHVEENDTDKATVTIAQGMKLQSFTVKVEIGEKNVEATIIVQGISGGVAVAHYFGVYPQTDDAECPKYYKDTNILDKGNAVFPGYVTGEGPVQKGDYILYMTDVITGEGESQKTSREPIPYYHTGSTWVLVDAYAENYSQIMGSVLGDVVNMPSTPATAGALYGFFQNLTAQTAFIHTLLAKSLELVNEGNEIGDIHSQGYYRGAYKNPAISSGFYLGADGYIELFKAILRDVEIISENNSGETIFSVGATSPALSYSKTETGTMKAFSDLFGYGAEGTLTASGVLYGFIHDEFPLEGKYLQIAYPVNETISSGESEEITLPYTCTFSCIVRSGNVSVYKNNSKAFDLSPDDEWYQYQGSSGDVIRIEAGNTADFSLRVDTFPDSCGGEGVVYYQMSRNMVNSMAFIYRSINGRNWVYSCFSTDIISASVTTGIVYNSQSFDSMTWYLGMDSAGYMQKSSSISGALTKFSEGERYVAASGCYVTYKGITRTVSVFIFNSGVLTIESNDGNSYTYRDDFYAKSLNLSTTGRDDAVEVQALMPASGSNTQIGSNAKKFRDIYCTNLHATNISGDDGSVKELFVWGGAQEGLPPGLVDDPTILVHAHSGFRIWSNRYIELHYVKSISRDGTVEIPFTYTGFDLDLDSRVYEFSGFYPSVIACAYGSYSGLVGTGNIPLVSVKKIGFTSCTIQNDGDNGYVGVEIKGKLSATSFNEVRNAYGF